MQKLCSRNIFQAAFSCLETCIVKNIWIPEQQDLIRVLEYDFENVYFEKTIDTCIQNGDAGAPKSTNIERTS